MVVITFGPYVAVLGPYVSVSSFESVSLFKVTGLGLSL